MIARRQFLKGTAAASAGLATVKVHGRDMAPPPEERKPWKGAVDFRIAITRNASAFISVGAVGKNIIRATAIHAEFTAPEECVVPFNPTDPSEPPRWTVRPADLAGSWPVDIRYGRTEPAAGHGPTDLPVYVAANHPSSPSDIACVGQHTVFPRVPFDIQIRPIRIDREHAFGLCVLSTSPANANFRIDLEEIIPESPEKFFF
jgi:hypothetical protein